MFDFDIVDVKHVDNYYKLVDCNHVTKFLFSLNVVTHLCQC